MLRPYQERAIALLRERWRDRPLLCLATGAGKTVVARGIADAALAKGRRVLVVAHTRQIIEQTAARFGCPMVMAEHKGEGPMLVASIQTLARRGAPPHDLLIVDEAHHATAASYCELVKAAPAVIGLTATPQRLDGRGLGTVGFGCIIEPVTVAELITDGYLTEPIVYAKPFVGGGLRVERGEFTTASSEEVMRNLHGSIAEHWAALGRGRIGVAFACSIAHGEQVTAALVAAGARAVLVSGTHSPAQRASCLRDLRERRLDVVVSVSLLGEGWDLPDLGLAILARPTASMTVYRQQVGRVMRASPDKPRPIVLDHAGNTARHGFVTEPVAWSLEGRVKMDRASSPGKTCPVCFAYVPIGCRLCPACGEEFRGGDPPRETDDALVAVSPIEDKAEAYTALCIRAWSKGYAIGWARRRFFTMFNAWPQMRAIENEHYPCVDHVYEQRTAQSGYTYVACKRCLRRPLRAGDPATDPASDRRTP